MSASDRGVGTGRRGVLLDQLVAALRGGRGALVLGDAGSGKSVLVSRALSVLGRRSVGVPAVADRLRLGEPLPDGAPAPLLQVEDAHLLDETTAEAVAWLARRGDVLVVATARPSAGSAPAWCRLWLDDVVERIDLDALDATEVAAMLATELGRPVDADAARRVHARTGGNALHVHELAARLRAAGSLAVRDGVWTLSDGPLDEAPVPDVVHRELAELTEPGREALELVAVLGPLSRGGLVDLVGPGPVQDLVRRGLVRTVRRDAPRHELALEPAHGLYAHAARSWGGLARRPALLRRAATTVLADDAASPQALAALVAGGVDVPLAVLRRAVDHADDPGPVLDVLDRVLDGPAGRSPDGVALRLSRARARRYLGDLDGAAADLVATRPALDALARTHAREAAALVVGAATLEAQLALGEPAAQERVEGVLGALDRADRWVRATVPGTVADAAAREIEVARLALVGSTGRHQAVRARALGLLEEAAGRREVLALVAPTVLGLLPVGRFDEAERLLHRYRPVAETHSADRAADDVVLAAFLARLWSGRLDGLDDLVGLLDAGPDDRRPAAVRARAGRGLLAAAHGSWSTARHELRAVNAHPASRGPLGWAAFTLLAEACAAAATGEAVAARRLLAEAAAAPPGAAAVLGLEPQLYRLDALVWLGDPAAPAVAHQVLERSVEARASHVELEAVHRLVLLERRARRSAPRGLLGRLPDLSGRVRTPRAWALVRHADALADGDPDLVRIAHRELNRRGLWLPLAPAAATAGSLTAREREVAALASAGLTSREIAGRLQLSARTVDSHLGQVYAKLGVRSRGEIGRDTG